MGKELPGFVEGLDWVVLVLVVAGLEVVTILETLVGLIVLGKPLVNVVVC